MTKNSRESSSFRGLTFSREILDKYRIFSLKQKLSVGVAVCAMYTNTF